MKNKYYATLSLLFYAICIGPLLFAALSFFLVNGRYIQSTYSNEIFLYVSVAASIASIAVSFLLYNNRVQVIKNLSVVQSRLSQYRTLFLLRMAVTEGACILHIVFYLLSGNLIFIYFYIGLAFVMFSFMPSINKICNEIDITEDDMKSFV